MSAQPSNDVRRVLADFAAGTATKDRVMRALMGHDGWFVPAAFASDALGLGVFDRTILLGAAPDPPPPQLAIFTDVESVLLAYGQSLGPFVGGVSGLLTFAALSEPYSEVRVNPASPREEQWNVEREAFALGRLWASAVGLERELAASRGRELPTSALRAYAGYTILVGVADRAPVFAPLSDGTTHAAIAFTAPDRAESFLARLPSEQRAAVTGAPLDGAALFAHLAGAGIVALLLNSDEPEQTVVIGRADLEALASTG